MADWVEDNYGPAVRAPQCRAEEIVAHLGRHLPVGIADELMAITILAHSSGLPCWGCVGDRFCMVCPVIHAFSLDRKYDPDPARRKPTPSSALHEEVAVLIENIWPRFVDEVAPAIDRLFAIAARQQQTHANAERRFAARKAQAEHEIAALRIRLASLKSEFARSKLPWNPIWEVET